jgi:stress response protein YsnF
MNEQIRENLDSNQIEGQLPVRLDNLKSQLIDFSIRDSEGQTLGRITDLTVEPANQLNLIVSPTDDRSGRLVSISSDVIEKIEYATHSVFILLTREHFEALPAYQGLRQQGDIDLSDLPADWLTPVSGSQSPGTIAVEARSHHIDEQSSLADFKQVRKEVIASNIPLREERLVVNRHKRKVGEVVVRKVIETRIIEVPVRREKLIVEQVSPEYKKLTEISLGEENGYPVPSGTDLGVAQSATVSGTGTNRVVGEFQSPEIAARILEEISKRQPNGCAKVRVELVVEEAQFRNTYQSWFDRYSTPQS